MFRLIIYLGLIKESFFWTSACIPWYFLLTNEYQKWITPYRVMYGPSGLPSQLKSKIYGQKFFKTLFIFWKLFSKGGLLY